MAWVVVSLLPAHNFIARSNQAALSEVGLEPLFEVTYFGIIGLFALSVIRRLEPALDRARPPALLYLFPLWVVASATWSDTGTYAAARGVELAVVATLGWATLALGRVSRPVLDELVATVLRWFVTVVLVLVGLGVAFGPIRVPASEENRERFTWIGAHPNGSGLLLAVAVAVVVFAPSRVLGWRTDARVVAGVVLLVALYDNHSRTAWGALLIGLVVGAALAGRLRPRWHPVLTPVAVLGAAAVAVVAWRPVADYALRGRGSESLLSANGRLGLWDIGVDALATPFDWACGLGYGAARSVFIAEVSWARTAHNSLLAALVSVGVIGLALLLVAVVGAVVVGWRVGLGRHDPVDRTLVAVLGVLAGGALTSDVLAEPNIGFAGLCLGTAVALARAVGGGGATPAGDQSPTAASTVSQPEPAGTS